MTPCPGPGTTPTHLRLPGKYLCRNCWAQLPLTARDTLAHRGPGAARHYRALVEQLRAGVPLAEIRIE